MNKDNIYKTKDIFEASYLYSQNFQFLGIEPNGKYSSFIFFNKEGCEVFSEAYWMSAATGNIKTFVNSYKTLKDLLFSRI